jgi:hypothetical protein
LANSDDLSAETTPGAPPRRQFRLTGPSVALEPGRFAVRRDLAEIDVADRIFAQHYAHPMRHRLTRDATVHRRPQRDADARGNLCTGDAFHVFDLGNDWAWGRGDGGPVGYIETVALERVA